MNSLENISPNKTLEIENSDFTFFKKISGKNKYNFYEYLSVMLNS